MDIQQLKLRIGILCELVMREENSAKLTEILKELDGLVEIYLSHIQYENPPPRNT